MKVVGTRKKPHIGIMHGFGAASSCVHDPRSVMLRILLPCFAALVACTPSPQETTMRKPNLVPVTASRESSGTHTEGQGSIPEPVSAAENPAPSLRADSPAEAEGRRTLSTAFVRMGAGGHLTVELRDGRAIVLRDVVMRPRDYCGVQVLGGSAGTRYCGGYGDVAAARPGGGPALDEPNPAVLNPVAPGRSPSERE
jgi:hypothetical protein